MRLDDRRRASRVRKRSCRPPGAREGLELRSTAFEPPEAPTTDSAASSRLDFDDGAACCQKTTALQEGPQDGLDGHDRSTEAHKAPPLDDAPNGL